MSGYRCVLLLSGVMVTVCGVETSLGQEEVTSSQWLDCARGYALKAKGDNAWLIWGEIAAFHALAGRLEQARAELEKVEDPLHRAILLKGLPAMVVLGGDRREAIRLAEMIEDREQRDYALVGVVMVQSKTHRFADAVRTIRHIEDPASTSDAWESIARARAEAGQYEAAQASAANMLTETDIQQQYVVETRAFISKAKASGLKRPRIDKGKATTPAEEARRVAGAFVDPRLFTEDLAMLKAEAEATQGAVERTSLWRQIAWLCHKADDPDGSRQAVDAAVSHAEGISDSYQRSLSYVMVADLAIELGDPQRARILVNRAKAAEKDLGLFRGLSSFTTAPVAVGVLIRCGQIDEAFELARTYGDEQDAMIWRSLGAFCASVGRTDDVERRLHEIESDIIKAYLCLGVWSALETAGGPASR